MEDNKYNGWTNYATWRVQLELVDDEVRNMLDNDPQFFKGKSVSDIADDLFDYVEEVIEDNSGSELVSGYAMAFVQQVNWNELAEHAIELAKEYQHA